MGACLVIGGSLLMGAFLIVGRLFLINSAEGMSIIEGEFTDGALSDCGPVFLNQLCWGHV